MLLVGRVGVLSRDRWSLRTARTETPNCCSEARKPLHDPAWYLVPGIWYL